jgi:hypothetical protein
MNPILDRLDHPAAERARHRYSRHSSLLQVTDKLHDPLEVLKVAGWES